MINLVDTYSIRSVFLYFSVSVTEPFRYRVIAVFLSHRPFLCRMDRFDRFYLPWTVFTRNGQKRSETVRNGKNGRWYKKTAMTREWNGSVTETKRKNRKI